MTKEDYNRSFFEIANGYNVTILDILDDPREAVANTDLQALMIAPVKDELSYFIALHELGHINNYQTGSQIPRWFRDPVEDMVEEANATEFALKYVPHPSADTAREAYEALWSRTILTDERPPEYTNLLAKLQTFMEGVK